MLKRNRTKGFTLIELLMVIAILGIITAIAVPMLTGQKQRAKMIGDAQTNTRTIQLSLENNRAERGIYGAAGTYEYKADGTRPSKDDGKDIIPTFTPKGNSKLDFKITIGNTGLTFDISVTDPSASNKELLTSDQTGAMVKK